MELTCRNVNDAFDRLVEFFAQKSHRLLRTKPYSNPNGSGLCKYIDEPVVVTYLRPWERVLLNPLRDANPFFHLYEALWMLSGSREVKPLAHYNSRITSYSDDGTFLNGAYGWRWRCAKGVPMLSVGRDRHGGQDVRGYSRPGVDQIEILVDHLKRQPDSRRAVLSMWNVEDDLLRIDESKDVCCNLLVKFKLRNETVMLTRNDWATEMEKDPDHAVMFTGSKEATFLDMLVVNRSNDLVWGMLGSNYVTFSVLQEYVAAKLGVEVGVYRHMTDDLHVYDWNFKPDLWLSHVKDRDMHSAPLLKYEDVAPTHFPLVKDVEVFDEELVEFVSHHMDGEEEIRLPRLWREPFLRQVAGRMCAAYHWHRKGHHQMARQHLAGEKGMGWAEMPAGDWRETGLEWLRRRERKQEGKG